MRIHIIISLQVLTLPGVASAHEAWVLSPSEFEKRAAAPVPEMFLSSTTRLLASVFGLIDGINRSLAAKCIGFL